jgi:hypothetical protein
MNFDRVDAWVLKSAVPTTSRFQAKAQQFRASTCVRALDEEKEALADEAQDETQKLQAELDSLVKEPKMFASFDSENFNEDALPVPLYTSVVILIGSLIWTYYLFDVGINGF